MAETGQSMATIVRSAKKLPLAYKLVMARTVLSGLCLLKGQRHQVGGRVKVTGGDVGVSLA